MSVYCFNISLQMLTFADKPDLEKLVQIDSTAVVVSVVVAVCSSRLVTQELKSLEGFIFPFVVCDVPRAILRSGGQTTIKVKVAILGAILELRAVAVLGKNVWGAWPLIIWEATTYG